MGPDLNLAYFWPAVNKRPIGFDLITFWPKPKIFFLNRRAKNWDFKGKFSNDKPKPKMADLTQPNPSNKNLTWPGSKNFYHDPSLLLWPEEIVELKIEFPLSTNLAYILMFDNLRKKMKLMLLKMRKSYLWMLIMYLVFYVYSPFL